MIDVDSVRRYLFETNLSEAHKNGGADFQFLRYVADLMTHTAERSSFLRVERELWASAVSSETVVKVAGQSADSLWAQASRLMKIFRLTVDLLVLKEGAHSHHYVEQLLTIDAKTILSEEYAALYAEIGWKFGEPLILQAALDFYDSDTAYVEHLRPHSMQDFVGWIAECEKSGVHLDKMYGLLTPYVLAFVHTGNLSASSAAVISCDRFFDQPFFQSTTGSYERICGWIRWLEEHVDRDKSVVPCLILFCEYYFKKTQPGVVLQSLMHLVKMLRERPEKSESQKRVIAAFEQTMTLKQFQVATDILFQKMGEDDFKVQSCDIQWRVDFLSCFDQSSQQRAAFFAYIKDCIARLIKLVPHPELVKGLNATVNAGAFSPETPDDGIFAPSVNSGAVSPAISDQSSTWVGGFLLALTEALQDDDIQCDASILKVVLTVLEQRSEQYYQYLMLLNRRLKGPSYTWFMNDVLLGDSDRATIAYSDSSTQAFYKFLAQLLPNPLFWDNEPDKLGCLAKIWIDILRDLVSWIQKPIHNPERSLTLQAIVTVLSVIHNAHPDFSTTFQYDEDLTTAESPFLLVKDRGPRTPYDYLFGLLEAISERYPAFRDELNVLMKSLIRELSRGLLFITNSVMVCMVRYKCYGDLLWTLCAGVGLQFDPKIRDALDYLTLESLIWLLSTVVDAKEVVLLPIIHKLREFYAEHYGGSSSIPHLTSILGSRESDEVVLQRLVHLEFPLQFFNDAMQERARCIECLQGLLLPARSVPSAAMRDSRMSELRSFRLSEKTNFSLAEMFVYVALLAQVVKVERIALNMSVERSMDISLILKQLLTRIESASRFSPFEKMRAFVSFVRASYIDDIESTLEDVAKSLLPQEKNGNWTAQYCQGRIIPGYFAPFLDFFRLAVLAIGRNSEEREAFEKVLSCFKTIFVFEWVSFRDAAENIGVCTEILEIIMGFQNVGTSLVQEPAIRGNIATKFQQVMRQILRVLEQGEVESGVIDKRLRPTFINFLVLQRNLEQQGKFHLLRELEAVCSDSDDAGNPWLYYLLRYPCGQGLFFLILQSIPQLNPTSFEVPLYLSVGRSSMSPSGHIVPWCVRYAGAMLEQSWANEAFYFWQVCVGYLSKDGGDLAAKTEVLQKIQVSTFARLVEHRGASLVQQVSISRDDPHGLFQPFLTWAASAQQRREEDVKEIKLLSKTFFATYAEILFKQQKILGMVKLVCFLMTGQHSPQRAGHWQAYLTILRYFLLAINVNLKSNERLVEQQCQFTVDKIEMNMTILKALISSPLLLDPDVFYRILKFMMSELEPKVRANLWKSSMNISKKDCSLASFLTGRCLDQSADPGLDRATKVQSLVRAVEFNLLNGLNALEQVRVKRLLCNLIQRDFRRSSIYQRSFERAFRARAKSHRKKLIDEYLVVECRRNFFVRLGVALQNFKQAKKGIFLHPLEYHQADAVYKWLTAQLIRAEFMQRDAEFLLGLLLIEARSLLMATYTDPSAESLRNVLLFDIVSDIFDGEIPPEYLCLFLATPVEVSSDDDDDSLLCETRSGSELSVFLPEPLPGALPRSSTVLFPQSRGPAESITPRAQVGPVIPSPTAHGSGAQPDPEVLLGPGFGDRQVEEVSKKVDNQYLLVGADAKVDVVGTGDLVERKTDVPGANGGEVPSRLSSTTPFRLAAKVDEHNQDEDNKDYSGWAVPSEITMRRLRSPHVQQRKEIPTGAV